VKENVGNVGSEGGVTNAILRAVSVYAIVAAVIANAGVMWTHLFTIIKVAESARLNYLIVTEKPITQHLFIENNISTHNAI
jgi:hypothetical protein